MLEEKEISKMKKGSIALVSQITTISKQRIYDPKTSSDILANLRVSGNTLVYFISMSLIVDDAKTMKSKKVNTKNE